MGVYVKDLVMPSNCMECMKSGLRSAIKCTEWKYLSAGLFESRRANTCPLVEIETPHGGLMDRDACIDYCRDNDQRSWEALAYAPTVIEAEGE